MSEYMWFNGKPYALGTWTTSDAGNAHVVVRLADWCVTERETCFHCKREPATRRSRVGTPYCLCCAINVWGYESWRTATTPSNNRAELQNGNLDVTSGTTEEPNG